MALTDAEVDLLAELQHDLAGRAAQDLRHSHYYQGTQRFAQIGLSIPPELRRFVVIANWARVVVDTIVGRQRVRKLILPGEETADPDLLRIWNASNMQAHLKMFNRDRCVYGRAFLSVGSNESDPSSPLIRVESPRQMAVQIDARREQITAAARFFDDPRDPMVGDLVASPRLATLYLPNATVWAYRDSNGRWQERDRDVHNFGAVPVVMHLNRRMSGSWQGESEMADIIPLADSAARALTDLQFSQAAHGAPRMWMTGVAESDFMTSSGTAVTKLEAYFNAVTTIANADGRVGQLEAADLKNFETAMRVYGQQAATVTGFPARYFGLTTTNPPAEGAIRADEAQLVERVEDQNEEVGMSLGWTAALAMRFAGRTVEGNRIQVDWHDPATPTVAQRMDAVVKAVSSGILSREGAWDELGWSEQRKAAERAYFEAEALDPIAQRVLRDIDAEIGEEPLPQ